MPFRDKHKNDFVTSTSVKPMQLQGMTLVDAVTAGCIMQDRRTSKLIYEHFSFRLCAAILRFFFQQYKHGRSCVFVLKDFTPLSPPCGHLLLLHAAASFIVRRWF